MNEIKIYPIGKIENKEESVCVKLDPKYAEGLKGLDGYSHVQILWWADACDNDKDRNAMTERKPYRNGPDEMGVFALRSPERPNPIAVSNADIAYVDAENGASQKMLEKCGYTREGLIRQGKMVSTWCDYYIYGILSSDER